MVNVQEAGVCAFKQNALASAHGVMKCVHGVIHVRSQAFAKLGVLGSQRIRVKWRSVHTERLKFRSAQGANHMQATAQVFGVKQIAHANSGRASNLICIRWANAAARGADREVPLRMRGLGTEVLLQRCILLLVIGHDHVGAITDAQVGANANAACAECVDLLQEFLRINHHAVTNDAGLVAVQNSGRDQVQRVALIAHLHGVAGIGATVVANDHVMLRGEQVNDLAFAFVPPLKSNNGGMGSSINAVSSGHGRGSGAKLRRLPRSGEW